MGIHMYFPQQNASNGLEVFRAFHLHQNKRIVISTEAAHSLNVSGAAEKSASLPPPSPATSAFAFAVAVAVGIRAGLQPSSPESREGGLRSADGWSVAPSVAKGAE